MLQGVFNDLASIYDYRPVAASSRMIHLTVNLKGYGRRQLSFSCHLSVGSKEDNKTLQYFFFLRRENI
jgi:hypothetical protein